jgi:hypothetical protein
LVTFLGVCLLAAICQVHYTARNVLGMVGAAKRWRNSPWTYNGLCLLVGTRTKSSALGIASEIA